MKTYESKLITEFIKGDHSSFRKIFEIYSKPLFHFSFSYLKSKETSEDVVQEVFLKVWENRQEIKKSTSFHSYLYTIALNSVRKHFNKINKINELKHKILADLSDQNSDFDDRTDYQYLSDKLHDFINRMPEKRRQIFVKKKMEEKSLKEIADELKIDTKTVEYHITEAMNFLRVEFEKMNVNGLVFFHLFIKKEHHPQENRK